MAEAKRKDHWNSLLETIGLATPAREPEPAPPAPEPVAQTPPPSPTVAAIPEPSTLAEAPEAPKLTAKKPAKTSGHWGKLAGMLGLAVAKPEPEPEPAPSPAPIIPEPLQEFRKPEPPRAIATDDLPPDLFAPPPRAEVARQVERSIEKSAEPRRDREVGFERGRGEVERGNRGRGERGERDRGPRREERGRDQDRSGTRESPREETPREEPRRKDPRREESRREEPRREESERRPARSSGGVSRRGFGEGLGEDWPPESHPEPVSESLERDDFAPLPEAVDEPAREDERLGFDRPPRDEGEGDEPRRRRRRRRRGGRRDEEHASEDAPRSREDADFDRDEPVPRDAFAEDEFLGESSVAEDDSPLVEELPRRTPEGDAGEGDEHGRRRRRRRRRGGHRDEGAEGAHTPAARTDRPERGDDEGDEDFKRPAAPSRVRSQRDHRRPASEEDEVDEMLQHELDEGPAGEGQSHRKIPTWQETVGMLVEANIAARSDRPEQRGGGRGRRPPHRGR